MRVPKFLSSPKTWILQFVCGSVCWRVSWPRRPSQPHRASCSGILVSSRLLSKLSPRVSTCCWLWLVIKWLSSLKVHVWFQDFLHMYVVDLVMDQKFLNFSFIGISQSILATSYVKWIDIWMIFTMIIPFLEASISNKQNKLLIMKEVKIARSEVID